MRGMLKAEHELDVILLLLDALDLGGTHLAVQGRRCGNAIEVPLVGLPAVFEILAVEFRLQGCDSGRSAHAESLAMHSGQSLRGLLTSVLIGNAVISAGGYGHNRL